MPGATNQQLPILYLFFSSVIKHEAILSWDLTGLELWSLSAENNLFFNIIWQLTLF